MTNLPERFERVLGPLPGAREARAISIFGLIAGLIMCAFSLYYGVRGETFMGRPLGTDFVEFYAAGAVLNDFDPVRIYDLPFLVQIEYKAVPSMPKDQMAMYGYPPYIAALYRPLARLPYVTAYCVWLTFSMTVYVLGLWLLFRDLLPKGIRGTATLMAVSSPMYILETWIGGQVSIFGFLALVLFVLGFRHGRPFLAGIALGCAIYKPSLVAIPVAMLVIGACWRAVAGFLTGAAVMALLSIWTVGIAGCVRWFQMLQVFRYLATTEPSLLRRMKYLDLNSFFALLMGNGSVARGIATVVGAVALVYLAWMWWQSRRGTMEARLYLWSATIAWALIINVYVPVYDTIVLVPALALAAHLVPKQDQRMFQLWMLLFYVIPWLTQSFAEFLHLQLFTILLAAFGYWVLSGVSHRAQA